MIRLTHIPDLRWNNLGPSGGHRLAELLQSNPNLVKLEVQGNHLGKETLSSLGRIQYIRHIAVCTVKGKQNLKLSSSTF